MHPGWKTMCEPSCGVLAGVIAQLSLPADQEGGSGEGTNPTMHMEVDWDLGVSGHSDDLPEEDEVCFLWLFAENTMAYFLLSHT